ATVCQKLMTCVHKGNKRIGTKIQLYNYLAKLQNRNSFIMCELLYSYFYFPFIFAKTYSSCIGIVDILYSKRKLCTKLKNFLKKKKKKKDGLLIATFVKKSQQKTTHNASRHRIRNTTT
ncbi:hypothetical protein PanWU01x14_198050, partial [Parasponia andersonii]